MSNASSSASDDLHIRPVRTDAEWAHARAIRERVFIEEQACPPALEWDAFDETSRHVLGIVDDVPMATARWRTVPHEGRLVAKLERFAILPAYRGQGHGRRLVQYVMADAEQAGFTEQILYAQEHLEAFYRTFGFEPIGPGFMEAGIPHLPMGRRTRS